MADMGKVGAAFTRFVERTTKNIDDDLTKEDVDKILEGLDADELILFERRMNGIIRGFINVYMAEAQSPHPNALLMAQYGIATGNVGEMIELMQDRLPEGDQRGLDNHCLKSYLGEIKRILLTMMAGKLVIPGRQDN